VKGCPDCGGQVCHPELDIHGSRYEPVQLEVVGAVDTGRPLEVHEGVGRVTAVASTVVRERCSPRAASMRLLYRFDAVSSSPL